MKRLYHSNPIKPGIQAALMLAILLFSLGPAGIRVVRAAPPVNDAIASAKLINSLIYVDFISTTEATPTDVSTPGSMGGDPDNVNCGGVALNAGYATVWYTYTPAITQPISVDTIGSNYDTFIAVWTGTPGNLSLVTCNDDTFENQQSELFFTGSAGTPYYIEVAQFSYYDDELNPPPPPPVLGGNLQFHAYISETNVTIAGVVKGKYYIPPGGSLRRGYANVDNGPAVITNTNGAPIIAAMRVIWTEPGPRYSYSEMMGLPKEKLSTEYWFPWYNNLDTLSMDQGFRLANLDTISHTIQVWVGATKLNPDINLGAGGSTRVNYPVNNGPIRIVCSTCNPLNSNDRIIAALRVIWREPGVRSSYSEMMGLPKEQLSSEYWFPWYNNLAINSMDQGFRIANVNNLENNTVQVYVGSTQLGTNIELGPGGSTRISYSVDNGPIRITCTTCTNTGNDKIIAALRVIWKEPGYRSSYSEMMGLPTEQLSSVYWFPWYNNDTLSMDQGFRIANVDTSAGNTVQVYVGSTQLGTDIPLGPGGSIRVGYKVDNGPIRIVCTTCTNTGSDKIIAAMRVIWMETGQRTSYSEIMGLSQEQLSTEYWFPWYNSSLPLSMDQGFRFGVP